MEDTNVQKLVEKLTDVADSVRAKTGTSSDMTLTEMKTLVDSISTGGADPYTGQYEVDPDFNGQVLLTRNKVMQNNVTVNPIEVERVSNLFGGTTVYIGGIING